MFSASNESNEPTEANVGRFIPKIQLLQWHKQRQQRYPQVYPPDDHLFGTVGGNQHTPGTTLKTFFDNDPNKPMECEVFGSRWNIEFDWKEPMYNQETGRCGVRLDDNGTAVIAKVSNIRFVTAKQVLKLALLKLKETGGTELDSYDNDDFTNPEDYLDGLLAVGDARFDLEQYDEAGTIYYRAYYITIGKGGFVNTPEVFPVAHKMLQAFSKSNEEMYLKTGHGMAQQTLRMPGCPVYIQQDMRTIDMAMDRKGIAAQDMMDNLRSNMVSIPNDRAKGVPPLECVDFVGERHRIESSASLDTIQNVIRKAGINDVIELPSGTFGGGAPGETLEVSKNLQLYGQGMDKTILKCNLVVKQDGCRG